MHAVFLYWQIAGKMIDLIIKIKLLGGGGGFAVRGKRGVRDEM